MNRDRQAILEETYTLKRKAHLLLEFGEELEVLLDTKVVGVILVAALLDSSTWITVADIKGVEASMEILETTIT